MALVVMSFQDSLTVVVVWSEPRVSVMLMVTLVRMLMLTSAGLQVRFARGRAAVGAVPGAEHGPSCKWHQQRQQVHAGTLTSGPQRSRQRSRCRCWWDTS